MQEYIVNIMADVVPGDIAEPYTLLVTYRVKANSEDRAVDRAVEEVIKNNRAIDTMAIKHRSVCAIGLIPVLDCV